MDGIQTPADDRLVSCGYSFADPQNSTANGKCVLIQQAPTDGETDTYLTDDVSSLFHEFYSHFKLIQTGFRRLASGIASNSCTIPPAVVMLTTIKTDSATRASKTSGLSLL